MSYENAATSVGLAGTNIRETRETEAVLNRILNLGGRLSEANGTNAETKGRLIGGYPSEDTGTKDHAPMQPTTFGQINDALDYLERQVHEAFARAGRMSLI